MVTAELRIGISKDTVLDESAGIYCVLDDLLPLFENRCSFWGEWLPFLVADHKRYCSSAVHITGATLNVLVPQLDTACLSGVAEKGFLYVLLLSVITLRLIIYRDFYVQPAYLFSFTPGYHVS